MRKLSRVEVDFLAILVNISLFSYVEPISGIPNTGFLISFIILLRYLSFGINFTSLCLLFATYNVLIVLQNKCNTDILKSLVSLILVFLFALGVKNIIEQLVKKSDLILHRKINQIFKILIFTNFFSIAFEKIALGSARPSGVFFSEPSHAAFLIVPITLLFALQHNIVFVTLGLLSMILAYSSSGIATLLILLVSIYAFLLFRAVIYLRVGRFQAGFMIITFLFVLIALTDSNTLDRLNGLFSSSNDSSDRNLSSLVYLNGWLAAFEYLKQTRYFGIGFNLMGCEGGIETDLKSAIVHLADAYLNYNDGSFLLSKMLSEFGLLSIFILLFLSFNFLKMFHLILISTLYKRPMQYFTKLGFALYSVSFVFIFVRSTDYFSLSLIYMIIGYYLFQNGRLLSLEPPK